MMLLFVLCEPTNYSSHKRKMRTQVAVQTHSVARFSLEYEVRTLYLHNFTQEILFVHVD